MEGMRQNDMSVYLGIDKLGGCRKWMESFGCGSY